MERLGSIYIIKNNCNDKVYIGQTTLSVEERFKQHLKPSAHKRHGSYKIYKAMNKYGSENFYYEILESNIPYNNLDSKEIYYIDKYDSFYNGYNSTKGGDSKTICKIEDIQDIILRLNNGDLVKDIAKDYNVCTHTIVRTLKAYDIPSPSSIQGKRKLPSRKLPRDKIRELYEKGLSYNEIANELHINQRSISRIIKELGLGKRHMIDYNSLDLDSVLLDFSKVEAGEMKKKDVLKKYGLNQHSLKVIKKLKGIE